MSGETEAENQRLRQALATMRGLVSTPGIASARTGASVTRRLLAFSRRDELRASAVDAAALLLDLREVLAHTLCGGIEARVEAPPGLPPLLADKGQLETVLVNLATNARSAWAAPSSSSGSRCC